jgi:hypothetical protein
MSEDCTPFLPQAAKGLVREGFFAPLPGPTIDGFFGARLVRAKERSETVNPKTSRNA